ncbi:MAG: cbb3-type cytochrome c oxidase subunit II, partial [Hyphomicrobiales bacterium]|nr:cbb3-type cytochrome c oxidase subunit II [Hyphomicrobiales bacterium]
RTGPDLARIGGKYSDDWHRDHLRNPRAVVPTSIMPSYPWLEKTPLDIKHLGDQMKTLSIVGVPYTKDMIDNAEKDAIAQGAADSKDVKGLQDRYKKIIVRDLGADKGKLTEMDAVIAYLQRMGTLVDFKLYDSKANIR